MKKLLPLLFLLVSFGLYAQVANDICATAINLGTLPAPSPCPTGGNATTYTYNGTTIGAAAENPYSSLTCMDAPAADVWVTFIASGNELDIAFTSGLNDANIGVYTGGCGGLIGLFCQASNNGNITTTLTPMEPGTQYWMQISGINATDFSNFTLNMTSVNNCSQCMLSAFVTASPAPTNGYYLPGTTVNLCLTVTGYNQIAANWMSGVQPTFGSGWNPATLSGTSSPNGSGSYAWYYADGPGSMGMGWYVDVDPVGPPGPDGNFANNYGDPSITGTNLNETFCFQITTDVACVPGASLNVSFNTYSDYETGGYGSPGCTGDPNISFVASTICCAVPLISAVGETCPGANNGSATAQGQGGASPYDYIWENPAGTVIYTNNNNAGVSSMSGLAAGTYTVTVTDNNGCVQIIDIVVPAAVGCPIPNFAIEPVDVTVSCIGNVPAMTNLTWTDNCGSTGVVTGVNGALVGGACGGTITRTWTYTNFCGNSDVATQIITIDDNINPTGTAPANVTVQCIANVPAQNVLAITNEADNCSTPTVTFVSDVSAGTCPTIVTRTYRITDACGNFINVFQTITVNDNIAPVLAAPPAAVTVQCAANVPAATNLSYTDNCSPSGSVAPVTGALVGGPCGGTITRTWTATDACGNSSSVTQIITVDDTTPPTATNPPAQSGTPPPFDPTQVTDEADNCGVPTVTDGGDVSDNGVCPEIITRTYIITDACGNFITVTQTFSLGDAVYPTASNPADINVECIADVPLPNPLVVTDEADNGLTPTVTFEDDTAGGGVCPDTIIRRYRVTDDCGNFIFVSQFIIIEPTTNPVVPANGSSTVNCLANAQVLPTAPPVTDVCGNALTPVVVVPADIVCEGTMAYTFTYTDCAGNASIWTYTYTIDLPTFAIATAPGASTVNCPANAAVQPTGPGAVSDMCGNTLTPVITSSAAVACEGNRVWTFTYTDCASNVVAWTYTYTVDMPTFAIATAPGASTVNCPAAAAVQPAGPGGVTDMCGNTVTPVVTSSAAVVCEGNRVWTFTYTDCASSVVAWTYTYTVDMPTFAIATAPGASTVNCPAAAAVQPAGPGVVTDLCGNTVTPVVTSSAAVVCEGSRVWTFTYTDCASNVVAWTYTYTVDMPTFTIPYANGASTVSCVADAQVDPGNPGVVTDMCGNTLTPVVTAPSPSGCTGVGAVWTYTYTDCAGNTAAWTHTYTINLAPFSIATAPGASTVNCPANAAVQPAGPGVVNDACGNAITPVITSSAAVTCEGNRVWTFTYTDCAGNTAAWTYTYTVDMPAFAIATAPGASTVNCPANAAVQPAGPGVVIDMCGNTLTPVITSSAAVACEGNRVWTFTYTDCAGNVVPWTYTYTVDMPTFAIATAPGASTVNCPANAAVQPAGPGVVTDMCGNTLTPVITSSAAVACEGNRVWTFTYTDCASNVVAWTYTYTVDMPTFAIATAPGASTVNCPANAAVQPAGPGVVTDLCGNTLTPVITSSAAVACEGNRVWTFTYTDCASNVVAWTYTYTVDMPTFAIATAPGASTVNCPANAAVQPAGPGVVTDLCGNTVTPVVTSSAAVVCEGSRVWTFTYTDCASNVVAWTYTYTVDMPTFAIPYANGASTVSCVADAQVDPGNPGVVTDMCGNTLTPVVTAPSPSGCTGVGAVWTYTYTDCAGNTAAWTHTYTINLAPFSIATAPGASTVNCPANAAVQPAGPGVVNDACGNAITPVITSSAAVTCEGNRVWTFTYTDCAGNTAAWTYTYTVDMPAFAIATAPGASTVNCPANAAVQPAGPGVVIDMCGNTLTPVITSSAAVACEGNRVWTFTYTDCAGNVVPWTYTYTVDMPTFAIATAPGASTVNCPANAAVQPAGPGAVSDMCGNTLTPVITSSAAVACEGNRVWTFTYTDCASNVVAWTYTYTVDMPTFAIATAPGASTVNCPANAAVQPAGPGVVTDLCGNTLTPVITSSAAVACEGNRVWTFTYTDCASNVVAWTYTYTVDMPTFAIATAPGASTVNCPANAAVQPAGPGVVTDLCGNTVTPVVTSSAAVVCEGSRVWTFTYTDCASNVVAWTYTYTVDMPTFAIATAPGASTVNCPADAAVQPAGPGVVTDQCGNTLIPVVISPLSVGCEGGMTWTFTYTDCASNIVAWTHTYSIDMPTFAIATEPGASTVNCPANAAVQPAGPGVVTDMCGNTVTPVITSSAAVPCEGDRVWTFTYTDCASNVVAWTHTYTIDLSTSPIVPANGSSAVACVADIYVPTPPVVMDACGNAIIPGMTENADPVCVGDKVYTFTYTDCGGNASIWTYTFSINDNVLPTASNPAPISVPGSMDVPVPNPLVVIDEADNCTANPTVVWVSDVSDGNVCNLEEVTRTYSVTDDCGNQIFVTQIITILAVPAPIDAGPDATICVGEFITLTAGNPLGVSVSWSPNNPPVDGVPFQPGSTQTYTVTADNLGCISTDSVTITLQELQEVSFIGDVLSGCEPLTVTFTNTSTAPSGLVNCVWNINGQSLSGCGSVVYTFDNAGLYDVTLTTTSATGCVNSVTYIDYIDVEAIPTASFNVSSTEVWSIDTQVDFTNTSVGASDYLWNFGDNSPSSILDNPSHTFLDLDGGSYQVELIAYSPLGCTDTAYRTIRVREELIYYVPNTFTPDGDAYNEYFTPVFSSGFDPYDFTMLIFNRWGEIVWESHDASVGWDGTYGGRLVQDGTYTWTIEFKTSESDKRVMINGLVNVIK